MKKIPIMMVLGYLLISFCVFGLYKSLMYHSNVATEAWLSVQNNYDGEDGEKEKIGNNERTLIAVVTREPILTIIPAVVPTKAPVLTKQVTVTPTPGLTEASNITLTAMPITEPVAEPTVGPKATPVQEETRWEDNRAVVEYKGKEILYCNTLYRMDEETLGQIVSMVRNEPYISSFALYDINTEVTISYNEERYYPVASTVKAPFIMTCLSQIEEGKKTLEDTMEYVEEYKVKGDGIIKNEKLGKEYTIKELMEYAIKISDDIGYLMLQGYFGYEYYNQFLKELGNRVTLDGNSIKWGQTSAIDSLRNWKEIYRYINSECENAGFFAELLKNTNKSFIRNVLGDEYEIYNKMGWVRNQCCHDHAIVMDEQPYILIIMTMGDVGKENQKFIEELAVILNGVHEEMVEE